MSKWIFVDVEATGRSPINGTMTEFGAVDYKMRQTFHGVIWESRPTEDNPAVSVITGKLIRPLDQVMADFDQWLRALGKDRPIFVSDNPAYDFQWINAAFDAAGMDKSIWPLRTAYQRLLGGAATRLERYAVMEAVSRDGARPQPRA